jgi:hypothetical protein
MTIPGTTHLAIDLAAVAEVSGWDVATAIGTAAAAVATLLAVGAALWIAGKDRRLAAEDAHRDHLTDLLLRMQGLLAESADEPVRIQGLLAALPSEVVEHLPAVRITYGEHGLEAATFGEDLKRLHRLYPGIAACEVMNAKFCAREVGALIGRINHA